MTTNEFQSLMELFSHISGLFMNFLANFHIVGNVSLLDFFITLAVVKISFKFLLWYFGDELRQIDVEARKKERIKKPFTKKD